MHKITRRDFLLKMQSAGATIPFVAGIDLMKTKYTDGTELFRNDFFSVSYDNRTGKLNVKRSSGDTLLQGSVVRASTNSGLISSGNEGFRHSVRQSRISDILSEGTVIIINSFDKDLKIEFILKLFLYKNHQAVFIEAEFHNRSSKPLIVKNIEPVVAGSETGGALHWPRTSKLLTNGPMYYNPGEIVSLGESVITSVESWWNIGLFRGYYEEGLAIGSVENLSAQGKILIARAADGQINITAQSVLSDGFTLSPGKSARSNRFVLNIGKDPYEALEKYASFMGLLNNARVNSIVNGWCNWFYTYEHINEDEVIRNAEFISKTLKPYGMEYVQVDEGYQRWHGEWEGNDRFPHGMKWLAENIRNLGLKPGLWIAPYVISEPSAVFRDHKEWLIKNPDGSLKRVGPWPDENSDWARNENPRRYGLDITHPGAAAWMSSLFDMVVGQWGYEMIKIDFVDWSLLSAYQYYDKSVSRAQAYRRGFEIMRKAIGNDCHLQDCGPGSITVGLLDSMRIELDQNYGYANEVWKQYFNSTGSGPAAAKRYYFHKRTWINDADHLCMSMLSPSQSQAAASLLALTGGNIISGDRLLDLDPVKQEILKKALPSWGEAAKPVDLYDTDFHRIFALKIRKSYGEWTIAGFFNSDESELKLFSLPLDRLWLDKNKTYIAFDFWNNKLTREIKNELKVNVPPLSVILLAIHEKTAFPKIVSTDRHILQGAVELEDVQWDNDKQILNGISNGVAGSSYNAYIHIPELHPWKQGGTALYHDFPDYTLKMTGNNILRMHLKFNNVSRIEWAVNFNEFFKEG